MKLIFKNSRGKERVIAEPTNGDEIFKEINKFLDDHNFKSYYSRSWDNEDGITIDVGSHSEFFVLREISFSDYIDGLNKKG